jgi:hypothetical protein
MSDKIVKVAAIGFVGLVLVPVSIDIGCRLIAATARRLAYNRKIRKGLKDGSIIEIDGKYYEVEISDVEEA